MMLSDNKEPMVAIVIINWNGYEDTVECIISLQKIEYKNYEIVLVDNGSGNDEAIKLEQKFSNIKIIRNRDNLGFSGGNNVGINYSLEQNAEFILLLNNDTIVEENFLNPLVEKFLFDKSLGIVAPQINYYSEPNRIWSAGGKISKIRGSGFAYTNKLESQSLRIDRKVDFVSGCCMLIKRNVFQDVGLFDERYFLYTEDTDFCFRARKAGFAIYITSASKIFHKVSNSTKENYFSLPIYYTTRNRLYFAKKNFSQYLPITFLYISITMLAKSIFWFMRRKETNINAVHKAFGDYLTGKMGMTNHKF